MSDVAIICLTVIVVAVIVTAGVVEAAKAFGGKK